MTELDHGFGRYMVVLTFLKTLICYFLIGIACLICIPPCMLIASLPARYRYDNKIFFSFADIFYKAVVRCLLNRVEIRGKQHIPKEPAIFVASHQSSLDIFLLGSLLDGYPHVWLVWDYYINTPILGFFIRQMFVAVDPTNPAKAARSLIQIFRFISGKNRHLLIFPEGGRFNDGTIHPFFEGFAIVARKTARPVIPVLMPNNGKIFPPHSFLIYTYPVMAIIGEPFYVKKDESDAEFTARVRQWFVDTYKKG